MTSNPIAAHMPLFTQAQRAYYAMWYWTHARACPLTYRAWAVHRDYREGTPPMTSNLEREAVNTDIRLLSDYHGNRVFVTPGREGLGLDVGGHVIVLPVARWHALARAALAPQAEPKALIAFLSGSAPLDGVWFGERHPTEKGAFWWRNRLGCLTPQAEPATEGQQAARSEAPAGWKWVPINPTKLMLEAAVKEWSAEGCYRAMLAASPSPEQAEQGKPGDAP